MKILELSIEEWTELADDPFEYFKIKMALSEGAQVGLKDEDGIIYAYLKIDEINNIKYVYKGLID